MSKDENLSRRPAARAAAGELADDGDERAMAWMARALGYAQVRTLTTQLLGGPTHDPEALVSIGLARFERGHHLGELTDDVLASALINRLRDETATTIVARTRSGSQMATPWRTASHALIFGGAEWFESVIDAGARAVPLRPDFDPIVSASARRLVEMARARRDEERRRDADTERIVRGPTR